jgi:signal transduction histidine kinase
MMSRMRFSTYTLIVFALTGALVVVLFATAAAAHEPLPRWAIASGTGVLVCIGFFYVMLDRGGRRLASLARWAGTLGPHAVAGEVPDFRFEEVNQLARALHGSFVAVADSVRREQEFSRFVSHELRSPLAVISANVDILESSPRNAGDTAAALLRMRHAVNRITNVSQALLWLTKAEVELPEAEPVDLVECCRQLVRENEYLRRGREVEVAVGGDPAALELLRVFCEIVLRNVIRNALQYAQAGTVRIDVAQGAVTVTNPVDERRFPGIESIEGVGDEHGFGIGMLLVETVAGKLGWTVDIHRGSDGHSVTLKFL